MGKQQLLYKYPPDLSKAQRHRLANRVFKGVQKDPSCQECECCDRKIGVDIVSSSCCYDKNQLAFLGPGIPLLFAYMRNAIILLVIFTVIFSGFCFYSNFNSQYCSVSNTDCEYNIFNTISFANKINQSDLLSIQNYILLAFVVVNIIIFQFFRYNFRQIEEQCDDIVNSPSDYSIILRRLPQNTTKEDIQKMVDLRRPELNQQEKATTENLKIDHIVLSYAMGEYTQIKQKNNDTLKKLIDEGKHAEFKPQPFPKLTQTAKLAIVVFSRQQSKDFFLYKPSIVQNLLQLVCDPCTPLSNFIVKGQRVSIERAPEPDDVVWQNSKISISGGIIRKSIFNVLGFIVLAAGGTAQYGLALLQNSVTDPTEKQIYSIGLSIIVSIFNFIILQFLVFSSHKERNETLTEFNTVLTVKISLFQFLNTGIFVVLAIFFADMNNFTITQTLPSDVTIVMLSNAFVPNISLWALNYFEITGKIFRWLVRNQWMKVTQMQANQIWQGPLPEIPYKYAYILKTIWLTAFYAPLVPVVVPISMVGLMLNYFIQKHFYRYVYSVPNMLSSMVNDKAMQLMQYFPLIMSLGEFIIYCYMRNYDVVALPQNWSIPIYISIALSFFNLVLPMDELSKCFKLKIDDLENPPYEKVQDKFQVTYEMTNPAYQCKKKRRRDVFLFNQVFGGQGKHIAFNMTDLVGLDQTNRSMIRDPLLGKQTPNDKNENFLMEFVEQNDQIPQMSKLKAGDTTMNTTQQNLNRSHEEETNPFAAFMKINLDKSSENPYQAQIPKKTSVLMMETSEIGKISGKPSEKEEIKNENIPIQDLRNMGKVGTTDVKGLTDPKIRDLSNPQKESELDVSLQKQEKNILPNSLLKNENYHESQSKDYHESQSKNHHENQQLKKGQNSEIRKVSPTGSISSYKSLTKDLNFKYNNSSSVIPSNSDTILGIPPSLIQNPKIQQQNTLHLKQQASKQICESQNQKFVQKINPIQNTTNTNNNSQEIPLHANLYDNELNQMRSELKPQMNHSLQNQSNAIMRPQLHFPSQSQIHPQIHSLQSQHNLKQVKSSSNEHQNRQKLPFSEVRQQKSAPIQGQMVDQIEVSNKIQQQKPNLKNEQEKINKVNNETKEEGKSKMSNTENTKDEKEMRLLQGEVEFEKSRDKMADQIGTSSLELNQGSSIQKPVLNMDEKQQQEQKVNLRSQSTNLEGRKEQNLNDRQKKEQKLEKEGPQQLFNSLVKIKQSVLPQQSLIDNQPRITNPSTAPNLLNQPNHFNQPILNNPNELTNLPYKFPNMPVPSSSSHQNTSPQLPNSNPKINQISQLPKPHIDNFLIHQTPNQPHHFQKPNQLQSKQTKPKIPLLSLALRLQSAHLLPQTPKTKPSPIRTFAQLFPNFYKEKQVSKNTRERFLHEGVKDLTYENKKYTKSGAIFYQSPSSTPRSTFPHVQIHVPGLKPVNESDELLRSSEKKRSFGRSNHNAKQTVKYDRNNQNADNKNNDDFTSAQIYNPRSRFVPKE